MKKLRVWILATLWFASVSGLSTYGVILAREAEARERPLPWGDFFAPQILRNYASAQKTFRSRDRYGKGTPVYANPADGNGFADLYRVGGPLENPAGSELELINLALARATSPETTLVGYWFVDITGDAASGGPYDYAREFGLCAVPAVYWRNGINTYVVDHKGTVWQRNTHGAPVRVFPDVENEGWVRAWD